MYTTRRHALENQTPPLLGPPAYLDVVGTETIDPSRPERWLV